MDDFTSAISISGSQSSIVVATSISTDLIPDIDQFWMIQRDPERRSKLLHPILRFGIY